MPRFSFSLFLLILLSSPTLGQEFGSVLAVSEDQVIVGDGRQSETPGVVYVYSAGEDGSWVEQDRLSAAGSLGEVDGFGTSLSIDGTTMVVGAPGSGSVYIFNRDPRKGWNQSSSIAGEGDSFGASVALSGDLLLVGTPESDRAAGIVSAFRRSPDGGWTAAGQLAADENREGDQFGTVIAIDGYHAIVSAVGVEAEAGTVFAFSFDPSTDTWVSGGKLNTRIRTESAKVGTSLLLNGNRLAVGVPGVADGTGIVVMFELDDETGEWAFAGRLSPYAAFENEEFGSSLASTGDALWVGSPGFGGSRGTGAIYQFDLDGETGDVLGSHLLEAHELRVGGQFGTSLAASDGLAVIGAPGYDNRAGVAFAATRNENGWSFGNPLENESFGYDSMAGELIECEDNIAGDFPCKDVDMTALVSMEDLGADRGIRTNDLWGWEDPETGREYAIVGLDNQTSFVDVTDPYNPVYLGELDMPATATMSVWRDMKVYKNHAYIVAYAAGEHGIQIFDLTQLRNVTEPVTFEETAHYSGVFSTHNIVINEETGFAYAVGSSTGGETCGGGLHMIDLREPAAPVFAGCFTDGSTGRGGTGYTHDAQCVVYHGPDTEHQGREICVGSNETALSIADVTDKSNPVSLSIADYPNVAYAHQGWFSEDQRYFYLNDELDEAHGLVDGTRTLIWDLIDLDEPELAGEFIAETTETDHNMYVKGNLLYQSTTSAGLHILDISDPEHPFETAYFDTSPIGGRGVSWSNYPYFKSGAIVVSGGFYGLFILKKKEVDI